MALTRLFEISSKSLSTYQRALSVSSNNIANASNPNFSRRRVGLSSSSPDQSKNVELGMGVEITDVRRVRNMILDKQIQKYSGSKEDMNYRTSVMGNIESLFSEPTDAGLSNLMKKFFNSWNDLSTDPGSLAFRNKVVNSARQMRDKIKSIYSGMDTIRTDLSTDASDAVKEINRIVKNLVQVNQQIYNASTTGKTVNTMMDRRDEYLKELGKYANINVHLNSDNTVTASMGGINIIDRTNSHELSVAVDSSNGANKLKILVSGDSSLNLKSGKLNAILDLYNKKIPSYLTTIDTIANTIMYKVNEVHSSMYSIETTPQTGINFFTSYSNGDLKINGDIESDPRKIAVSSDGSNGNNDGALAIADLADQNLIEGDTIAGSYSDLVTNIANEKSTSKAQNDTFDLVLQQLDAQQSQESGVNVDEEMVNVLKYQRSYDASAKLIKIADEILKTLIGMV
jgi:flagellar hook-associated protein 1 FlgK